MELAGEAGETGSDGDIPLPDEMPWWEAPDVLDEDDGVGYADMPDLVDEDVLEGIRPPEGLGLKLVYNAVAISCVPPPLISFNIMRPGPLQS